MPGSLDEGKQTTVEWFKKIKPQSVLDVGAGLGTYARLIKDNDLEVKTLDAIEVWKPYIDHFKLNDMYNNVYNIDARMHNNFNYDVVIFGDILEHMSKNDAVLLWNKMSKQAKYAIISIPIVHYPQGHVHGNPYEEHIKDDWSTQEVLDTFNGIVDHQEDGIIGVFYAEFIK